MVKQILKYSLLLGIILGFTTCDKVIFDQKPDNRSEDEKAPIVYLTITRGDATQFRSSPNQPNGASINTDTDDYEDWVHSLALLVFDTASGSIVAEHFDDGSTNSKIEESFRIELTAGQRDFYFVANMPQSDMVGITTRSEMDTYMKTGLALDVDLYHKATVSKGFPMARVYSNQTVSPGGTVYQPHPFKPVVDNVEKDKVELIRVVAQLQVNIVGEEIGAVKNVHYRNAFRNFSLLSFDSPYPATSYYADATGTTMEKSGNTYYYYMPEAFMTNPVWGTGDHKPVNYFVIETLSGTEYEIPIISHDDAFYPGGNYLTFARGEQTQKPDYTIYRNRRYIYKVKSLEDIEIEYIVDPWQLVPASMYMGYGYNVIIDEEGNITIENTIDDCMPHKVMLRALNGAYFGDPSITSIDYGYLSDQDPGYGIEKTKAGYSETFGPLNHDSVDAGEPYLEIYYNYDGDNNPILVKTYTK